MRKTGLISLVLAMATLAFALCGSAWAEGESGGGEHVIRISTVPTPEPVELGTLEEIVATEVPELTPEPTPELPTFPIQDFSDRHYLLPIDFNGGSMPNSKGYIGEWIYTDSTISVSIETSNTPTATGQCQYWVADIYIQDASQLRTHAAGWTGSFDSTGQMEGMSLARRTNPVLALNGDYYNSSERRGKGFIFRQGIMFRNNLDTPGRWDSKMMDVLLVDEDGDFHALYQPLTNSIYATVEGKRILNAFSFGPILVDNGQVVWSYEGADRWIDMATEQPRQRMCLCQAGPLHYKVICCAGPYRGNTGMTMREFAELAASKDVRVAYNLDGGDSTWLYFRGQKVNEFGSNSQRKLMDIIYFASAENYVP